MRRYVSPCFFFPQLRGRSSVLFGKSEPWFWTWRLVKFVKSIHRCKREKRRMSGVPDWFFSCNFIPTICSHWLKHCRFLFIMRLLMEMNEGPIGIPQKALMPGFLKKSSIGRENWHLSNHQTILDQLFGSRSTSSVDHRSFGSCTTSAGLATTGVATEVFSKGWVWTWWTDICS